MPAIICLLIAVGASYVRVATKAVSPTIESQQVWVFFTDKGVYNETQYDAALSAVSRSAAGQSPAGAHARPDFNDIPVREYYIREIENLGGRLRTVSNWLDAASFDMTPDLAQQVYALPFVYDIKPVISRTTTDAGPFPLGRVSSTSKYRSTDTADARRFYGPSYDQAQLMGVPDLFFRGYFGSNVKLALFDTGIKLTNRAIAHAHIYKQHDFISGDNCYVARATSSWQPAAVDSVRFLGFARGLTMSTVHAQSGSRDTLVAAFCSDSFAYGYNPPSRALFADFSIDGGVTWSKPSAIVTSAPFNTTFENLTMAGRGQVTYLAYNDLNAAAPSPSVTRVYLGYFIGTNWHGTPVLVDSGRYPVATVGSDTLYVAYVRSDSYVVLQRALVVQPEPDSMQTTTFGAGEVLAGLQLEVGATGDVDIFATGLKSGRVSQYRSTDGGRSFSKLADLVTASAAGTRLLRTGQRSLLMYEDQSGNPFARLATLLSSDNGLHWTTGGTVADSVFSIGSFDAVSDTDSSVTVIYETGGLLYRTKSSDFGANWSGTTLIDTTGFNSTPTLTQAEGGPLVLWFKNGDDSAVWQAGDTAKFSKEQPYHGTQMASLITGFQQGGVIGVAPGVQLLLAKTELYKVSSGRLYEYTMEEDAYVQALEWADRMGADVISTSLGYRGWYADNQFDGKTAPISIAASIAAKRGLLIVTAMGNRTIDSTDYPWPVPFITAPGDADGVITAGGIEKNLLPWRGTGTGPTSDGRVKPDLVALSDTVAVVSVDSEDYLEGAAGTSCATALIAGACALLKEAHPRWTADSVKAVLFATATHLASAKSDTFGYGVPRVDSAYRLFPPESIADVPNDQIGTVFPNPFVPASQPKVYFELDLTRPATEARIRIFSASGVLVDTITLNTAVMTRPGRYGEKGDVATLEQIGSFWDGKNQAGKPAAAGLYLAVLETTFGRGVAKFALVR
ncbi:MAG TPA: S8 family serine peptidase [bacterium]|nr:S8 family serine peptidase [bacterium]